MDKSVTGEFETSADVLAVLKLLELGGSLCLGDLLARDFASSDLLDGIDGGLGGSGDTLCGAGDGSVKKTSIRVNSAGGGDLGAGSCSVAEDGEARRPLDGGLSSKEGAEDSNLGLVELAGEGAGAGESNDHGVATIVSNAFLTTVVLGLLRASIRLIRSRGGDIIEELVHPLGELAVVCTVGNNSEVGLGIGDLGEVLDALSIQVLCVRSLRCGGGGHTEATVESQAVGRVGGHVGDAGEEALVGQMDQRQNLLVVYMSWPCQFRFLIVIANCITSNIRWYLVLLATSPRSSTKYGRSSRRNLASRTRFSRE